MMSQTDNRQTELRRHRPRANVTLRVEGFLRERYYRGINKFINKSPKNRDFRAPSHIISEMIQDAAIIASYGMRIKNHTKA